MYEQNVISAVEITFHRDGSYTVTSGGENFAVRDVSLSEVDKKTILSCDVGGRVTRSNAVLDQDVVHLFTMVCVL